MKELLNEMLKINLNEMDEKEAYFIKRTMAHRKAVQQAAKKIVDKYPEYEALIQQAESHDASKLEEPERTPYIALTWRHKLDNFKSYKTPGDIDDKAINKATLHHILNNSHHPEYHLKDKSDANIDPTDRDKSMEVVDVPAMGDIDLAEMVADWQAMSEELKNNTSREWYDKQKGVRWNFTPKQDKVIDKLLSVFEDEE